MSDIPPVSNRNDAQARLPLGRSDDAPRTQILNLPESAQPLRDSEKTLQGKIIERNENGEIKIRTPEGDVTVKIDSPNVYKTGDTVELKLSVNTQGKIQARLNTAQQIPPPQQLPPQDIIAQSTQTQSPSITIQTAIENNIPLPVLPLTAEQLQTLVTVPIDSTQPIIETHLPAPFKEISFSNTPMSNQFLTPDTQENNFALAPNILNAPDAAALLASEAPDFTTFAPIHSANLTLPVRVTLPYIIKTDKENLILSTNDLQQAKSFLHGVQIKNVEPEKINFTTPEQPLNLTPQNPAATNLAQNIYAPETQDNAHPEQSRARIVGLTREQHFPAFTITAPENHRGETYYFTQQISDVRIGDELLFVPLSVTASAQDNGLNISNPVPSMTPTPSTVAPDVMLTTLLPIFGLPALSWPALDEIHINLSNTAPEAAKALNTILPSAQNPAQLGNATLFFIAALRSGDFHSWLGDRATDTLKRIGKPFLLDRLGQDMDSIRNAENASSASWKSLSLPLTYQNEIHRIMLHYKKEQQDKEDHNKNNQGQTRFVMDLRLSNMGKLQLDALFQPRQKRMDLILRAEQIFSRAMQMEMRSIYASALEETAYTGELTFQGDTAKWVSISGTAQRTLRQDI